MSAEIRLPGLPELRRPGFQALVRERGAANALRFLHLCGTGQGDYTRDRDQWQIEEEIGRMKARNEL